MLPKDSGGRVPPGRICCCLDGVRKSQKLDVVDFVHSVTEFSMSTTSTTMTIRLPEDVKQRLSRLAESTDRSRSWLAADAIAGYLERQEWQIEEIEQGVRDADAGDFAGTDEVGAVFSKWLDAP